MHSRAVWDPKEDFRTIDRSDHIETYLTARAHSVPLVEFNQSLLSAMLGSTGLHHNFYTAEQWRKRVKDAQARAEAAKKKVAEKIGKDIDFAKIEKILGANPRKSTQLAPVE